MSAKDDIEELKKQLKDVISKLENLEVRIVEPEKEQAQQAPAYSKRDESRGDESTGVRPETLNEDGLCAGDIVRLRWDRHPKMFKAKMKHWKKTKLEGNEVVLSRVTPKCVWYKMESGAETRKSNHNVVLVKPVYLAYK